MHITPLDIRQKQFTLKFRGFDIHEVDQFLEMVGEDLESLIRENNVLKDELSRQESRLQEYRDTEVALKNTMMTAQQIVEDLKRNAQKEAELTLREAERKGDAYIKRAEHKAVVMEGELMELKRRKWEYLERMRGFLHTFERMIEDEEQEEGKWSIKRERSSGGSGGAGAMESRSRASEKTDFLVLEEVQDPLPMEEYDNGPSTAS